MGKMIAAVAMAIVVAAIWKAEEARACEPAPWSFAALAGSSEAIVYGEAKRVSQDGRQAELRVTGYAGPGKAPSAVNLPPTESGLRSTDHICPDFSVKFRQGAVYLVFLKKAGAAPELLHPDWVTALEADGDGRAMVDIFGTTESAEALLQLYASERGWSVQTPEAKAPVWGTSRSRYGEGALPALAAAAAIAGILIYAVVRRRTRAR